MHFTSAQQKPSEVLLLDCFHFDNPGLDVAKFENANIPSENRHAEAMEVVASLKPLQPDKIFEEVQFPGRPASTVVTSNILSYGLGLNDG